ncbi:MAG: hypothetical protein AB7P04_04200 [Bacteriovoracia bacterium]
MSFKPTLAGVLVFLSVAAGCGILGEKDPLNEVLTYGAKKTGCLNELGPRFERYMRGDVSREEWDETWDCTIDSLELFIKFVSEGSAQGYTQGDILSFVRKVLVTNVPVSNELVAATFKLKASLLGGSDEVLKKDELRVFVGFLRVAKVETMKLLPALVQLKSGATPQAMLALSTGIQSMGINLANAIKTNDNPIFPNWALGVFLDELGKVFKWKLTYELMKPVLAIKTTLIGGKDSGIEGIMWPRFIRKAADLGGPVVALLNVDKKLATGPNEYGEFLIDVVKKIQASLDESLGYHGGALTIADLSKLIESFPDEWMTIHKMTLKYTLKPLLQRIMQSPKPDELNHKALDNLVELVSFWNRGLTHLETIFEKYGLNRDDFTLEEFEKAAKDYAQGVKENRRAEVDRLVRIAKEYVPIYAVGTEEYQMEMRFNLPHTLLNLRQFHWYEMLASHLIRVYSDRKDGTSGTKANFRQFYDDFTPIGIDLKVIDKDVPNTFEKRYREADLFTHTANGDGLIQVSEATHLAAVLTSISLLGKQVEEKVEPICSVAGVGRSVEGNWMNVDCFRKENGAILGDTWTHFPYLADFYKASSDADRKNILIAMEKGGRRYGYSQYDIGDYDVKGLSGVTHYVELLFLRFDADQNGILDTKEVMRAYPVFKATIAQLGELKPDDDAMIESVFTYMVRYGKAPSKDLGGIIHFLSWKGDRGRWKLAATRKDIFAITAYFGSNDAKPDLVSIEPIDIDRSVRKP